MKYRDIFLKILVFIIFSVSQTVSAEEITIVTENFPPYNYQNATTGKVEGISTEIIRAILKEANNETKIRIYPWPRAYDMAQTQKNVLIYSMKRTTARENQFKWVAELVKHESHFLALKGSPILPTDNLEEIKKYKIGAIRGGAIAKALAADGFPNIDVITDREGNWKKLKIGRFDLWCTNLLSARYTVKSLGENFNKLKVVHLYQRLSKYSLYGAFSKQTDDAVVDTFKKAFK
ncbi:substrate-binding periplasmic protein, partial [Candidatus Auribacterota bacterium]